MGLVAPRHVGSSRTRDRTHVPCNGRQILNRCATREVPHNILEMTGCQGQIGPGEWEMGHLPQGVFSLHHLHKNFIATLSTALSDHYDLVGSGGAAVAIKWHQERSCGMEMFYILTVSMAIPRL